ncbi:MAG: YicC/YloC family endoribonuclease [Alphaproteobacteria bacterium]
MTVSSMTGFARVEGAHAPWVWYWEGKSVNGRGLELRYRLPPGLDALESELRQRAQKLFKRGNIQVTLFLERTAGGAGIKINKDALAIVMKAINDLRTSARLTAPDPAGVLALKGVIESGEAEEDEALIAARDAKLLATADELLSALAAARNAEGRAIGAVIEGLNERIAALAEDAHVHAATQPEMLRTRMKEQIKLLLDGGAGVSEDRLTQELALIAVKADVREEIDRLRVHVKSARELLNAKEAVGRKLDFLSQEFNREANTLCSKAADVGLTSIGLELKAVIDQFREQVQNIE